MHNSIKWLATCLLITTLPTAADPHSSAGLLTVHINGIIENSGSIELQLLSNQQQYDEQNPPYRECSQPADTQSAICVFSDVPHGDYAIFVFHDKNSDGDLNMNYFGIPTERLGLTNVNLETNEYPSFDDSKFSFNSQHAQVFLNLQ
ncbi:DUF2141 domain-containing protein [Aliivibrio kagoshimensis]|uniref:DUF2141 domain-containing protein n=1 Tax=Aliivibrio kagoshimensis TaxID=2910230 RepID=UPI003D0FC5CC